MKIGELAKATATSVESIRYYEREGLLPVPARTDANYRLYGAEHIDRLNFIRHCRCLDMTLDEVRTLLHFRDAPAEDCGDVNTLLDEHIGHVTQRIAELRKLKAELHRLRQSCAESTDAAHCGILGNLALDAASHGHEAARTARHIAGAHGTSSRRRP